MIPHDLPTVQQYPRAVQDVSYCEQDCFLVLNPLYRCPNAAFSTKADRAFPYVEQWASIYLKDALARLSPQLKGYNMTIEDVYTFQQMCAYEVSKCS